MLWISLQHPTTVLFIKSCSCLGKSLIKHRRNLNSGAPLISLMIYLYFGVDYCCRWRRLNSGYSLILMSLLSFHHFAGSLNLYVRTSALIVSSRRGYIIIPNLCKGSTDFDILANSKLVLKGHSYFIVLRDIFSLFCFSLYLFLVLNLLYFVVTLFIFWVWCVRVCFGCFDMYICMEAPKEGEKKWHNET